MNLKLNLWTLLFVLAVGALAFVLIESKSINNLDKILKIRQAYSITKSDFITEKDNYCNRYVSAVRNPALNLKNIVGVDTMGITAYTLREYELDVMYNYYNSIDNSTKKPKVYVYPIIKDYNTFDPSIQDSVPHSEFDLVFLIRSKNGHSEEFFDFTEPCPPVCGVPYTVGCNQIFTY